jgi:hypothetical protein
MISVSTNIKAVIAAKLEQIQALQNNPDPILRTVAMAVLPEFKHRIHIDGKDSNGSPIGTYSAGYMVLRTGAYRNADRKTKGAKKGELKNAGKFTKGVNTTIHHTIVQETSKVGLNRLRYNRTSDTKVILSLTRQMENDLNVVPSGNGYGIGYLNSENRKKADYCEATYQKKILTKLTKEERALAIKTAQEFTPEYLKTLK